MMSKLQNNQEDENNEPCLGEAFEKILRSIRQFQESIQEAYMTLSEAGMAVPGAIMAAVTIIFLFWYSDGDLSNLPWSENGGVQWSKLLMDKFQ
jgi:hypothetical protein